MTKNMTVNVYKMAIFNDVYYINTSLLRNTVNPSVFRGYQPLVSRRLASNMSDLKGLTTYSALRLCVSPFGAVKATRTKIESMKAP